MGFHEEQIRRATAEWIAVRFPRARMLHEVGLMHGQVRADLVMLTPQELHGFELKSRADKLHRLPAQMRAYGETMDRATLVVAERLYMPALSIVPAWWGLCIFRDTRRLELVREAAINPSPSSITTARLLWKVEALALLRELGKGKGFSKTTRLKLYKELVRVLPADELRARVRHRLLVRPDWMPPR